MEKAGGGVRDAVPPPPRARHTALYAWGSRPDRLYEVRPQERDQRRSVQQIVDIATLPTLDDPAPLMGEQLVEVYKLLDVMVPEQY